MACWATLEDGNELIDIFPDKRVPIRSIVPFVAREDGGPLCYMVHVQKLTQGQIGQLAQLIYQLWGSECRSVSEAEQYVRSGLPLDVKHFASVSSDDYFQVPWGAVFNFAIRQAYNESDRHE